MAQVTTQTQTARIEAVTALGLDRIKMIIRDTAMALRVAKKLFGAQEGWQKKNGIYLCVADSSTGLPLAVVLIGQVPKEKAPKYAQLSQEKAYRLAQHPNHSSSWQSRDPDNDKWGGAVRAAVLSIPLIISISGLDEAGDEAVALEVAWSENVEANHEIIAIIAKKSNNPYQKKLSKAIQEERSYEDQAGS